MNLWAAKKKSYQINSIYIGGCAENYVIGKMRNDVGSVYAIWYKKYTLKL